MSADFEVKFRGVWVNPRENSDGSHDRKVRAEFSSEYDAAAWQYGLSHPSKSSFVIENAEGVEVVIRGHTERDGRLSHTYAVLASLDKAEREQRQQAIADSGLKKGDLVVAVKWPNLQSPANFWKPSFMGVPGRIAVLNADPTKHPVVVEWREAADNKPYYGWFGFDDVRKP